MSADVSSQLPGPGMDRAPGDPGATSSDVPQESTAALQDARRAAINLMEDALEARGRAEQLSRELLREIAERETFAVDHHRLDLVGRCQNCG